MLCCLIVVPSMSSKINIIHKCLVVCLFVYHSFISCGSVRLSKFSVMRCHFCLESYSMCQVCVTKACRENVCESNSCIEYDIYICSECTEYDIYISPERAAISYVIILTELDHVNSIFIKLNVCHHDAQRGDYLKDIVDKTKISFFVNGF